MFHCPGSYCVPYRKLCDGKKDCPGGHDEVDCGTYSCPGKFSRSRILPNITYNKDLFCN